ncbi:sigma-70 family RNA polymerase sigma factor [Nocardioides mangrovicus]|uniref:Sigma-70 family RNA polymerase sigma factor n=1 Tax=Nocardioides mangrovicus TaxID=2478913 RepID=A0A3L8P3N2_9ACTN|nr:sigma-70 family RNA polymerase sigma factor [Nocardioides mangrovicus]RLV50006.1 sigma-70 family RNA polymerase sigma factor [Nocardioides mangrovicus]
MERGLRELVLAARAGDESAWDALVERFLPLVCGTIARVGLRGAEADDVNQTVWLRLVEHLDGVREPAALPGWLATTARRESVRVRHSDRRAVPVDLSSGPEVVADGPDVDAELLRAERGRALREALDQLPEDRRRLLLLLIEDPPRAYAEVSALLGIPIGTIGPTRARALEQLRNAAALVALAETTEETR